MTNEQLNQIINLINNRFDRLERKLKGNMVEIKCEPILESHRGLMKINTQGGYGSDYFKGVK